MYLEPVNIILPGTALGIIGYILLRRSTSRKWFKAGIGMLIGAGLLFLLGVLSDRIYVIEESLDHSEKWHIGFDHSFLFNNGRKEVLHPSRSVTINNTSKTLNIKSVTYVKHSWLQDNEAALELVVEPYSAFYFNHVISWWFTEPPESINVKNMDHDFTQRFYVVVAE
jgi:hypothetical protein